MIPNRMTEQSKSSATSTVGFLASRTGSAMRAIFEAVQNGTLSNTHVGVLIVSQPEARALEFAQQNKIPWAVLNKDLCSSSELLDRAVTKTLQQYKVDIVILSGYLRKIGPITLSAFPDRILNVHPALLPQFGGTGMYGDRVHKAVLSSNCKYSGATVHLINEEYDEGPIVAQRKFGLQENTTLDELRTKVKEIERSLIVDVLKEMSLSNGRFRTF